MRSSKDRKLPRVSGFDGLDTMSPKQEVKDAIAALERMPERTPLQQTELDRLRMILPRTTEMGGFQELRTVRPRAPVSLSKRREGSQTRMSKMDTADDGPPSRGPAKTPEEVMARVFEMLAENETDPTYRKEAKQRALQVRARANKPART